MRSQAEILFRVRQESRNLWMLARAPSQAPEASSKALLPPVAPIVERLQGTEFAERIAGIAEQILLHRFPLLGGVVETGEQIHWRRDHQRGLDAGLGYFRRIPYLDASRAGDHKIIWELNRHQHLVVLAQAHLLTGRAAFLKELEAQLESWIAVNPFLCGINWASALEAAFRALSWIWVLHLTGDRMEEGLTRRLTVGLYRHGLFIENNLSVYFSPNTHLLGEAVALHALGRFFSRGGWELAGARWIQSEIRRQVREDGSHFEQSSYYHVYALDMLLFHAALGGSEKQYAGTLTRMAEYLAALLGPARTLPSIGDDDGGRFFHPYGERKEFARATLATCGVLLDRPGWVSDGRDLLEQALWWLGADRIRVGESTPPPHKSHFFPDAGLAIMVCGDRQTIIDGGPFGPGRAGHSHSDTLSLIVRAGGRDLLIDPGTYTYVGELKWRDWFRGSVAHNTIRIDERDQATPMGPFWWAGVPAVGLREWIATAEHDYFDAECSYRNFLHRRRVLWIKPDLIIIFDEVNGPAGEHALEQLWHLGDEDAGEIVLERAAQRVEGWNSPVFGQKIPAQVLRVLRTGPLPGFLAAAIVFGKPVQPVILTQQPLGERRRITLEGGIGAEIVVSPSGLPQYRLIL